jgi:hypothetical protein
MRNIQKFGVEEGEDLGLDKLMMDGRVYDLSQTAEEKEALRKKHEVKVKVVRW